LFALRLRTRHPWRRRHQRHPASRLRTAIRGGAGINGILPRACAPAIRGGAGINGILP